jgi:hypothetical protein
MIRFFESHEELHVECHRNKLLIYKRREVLGTHEIVQMEKFADELLVIHEQAVSLATQNV